MERLNRISVIAAALARRPDTVWVDVLGGGDEICTILFLEGPDARNTLLRELPGRLQLERRPCCQKQN
ncbi:hypothetical protein [Streptomyces sp. NPDC001435]|uniref:hypothetical protein n=1 Tax=unclassified Streptomyces TaxID=2593676 RepID=UPI00367F0D65